MPTASKLLLAIPVLLLLSSTFSTGVTAATTTAEIAGCVALAAAARADCLRTAVLPKPVDRRTLTALQELVDSNSAEVERLTRPVDGATGSGATEPTRVRAELLDLRAQAFARMGKGSEAAAAMRAAIVIDDGATRLTWRSRAAPSWSAVLDPGNGRLARAAGILSEAGQAKEARPWLAQSLAAGDGASARALWERAGGGPIPGLDPESAALRAAEWFPALPDLRIRLLGKGEFDPASVRGKVLLLDFWASWCAPCLRELPELAALQERHRDAGLVVFTVNARETQNAAESTFRSLGLKLPIGVYDDALERAFNVRMLPTLILVDREGRIRARWDSRVPDIEADVETRVRSVLANDVVDSTREIAQVLAGRGLLAGRFTRELPGVIGAAAILGGPAAEAIVVVAGDQWIALDRDGKVTHRTKLAQGSPGRVAPFEARAGQPRELLAFRPGRDGLLRIDAAGRELPAWKTEGAVLDAAVLPGASPGARAVIASSSGLASVDAGGSHPLPGSVSDPCAVGVAAGASVVAATRSGKLAWLDPARAPAEQVDSAGDACGPLVTRPGDGGFGVTPSSVRAAAVGRFLGADAWQAALVTADEQLVLVDLTDGSVRARFRWPGIRVVTAGDIDGDGRDELLAADGRRVTLLGAPPR